MEVRLTERYKVRTIDRLNLQLLERRDVGSAGETRAEWVATGNYFGSLRAAVTFVHGQLQRDDPYRGDLRGAVARMGQIAEELAESVRGA